MNPSVLLYLFITVCCADISPYAPSFVVDINTLHTGSTVRPGSVRSSSLGSKLYALAWPSANDTSHMLRGALIDSESNIINYFEATTVDEIVVSYDVSISSCYYGTCVTLVWAELNTSMPFPPLPLNSVYIQVFDYSGNSVIPRTLIGRKTNRYDTRDVSTYHFTGDEQLVSWCSIDWTDEVKLVESRRFSLKTGEILYSWTLLNESLNDTPCGPTSTLSNGRDINFCWELNSDGIYCRQWKQFVHKSPVLGDITVIASTPNGTNAFPKSVTQFYMFAPLPEDYQIVYVYRQLNYPGLSGGDFIVANSGPQQNVSYVINPNYPTTYSPSWYRPASTAVRSTKDWIMTVWRYYDGINYHILTNVISSDGIVYPTMSIVSSLDDIVNIAISPLGSTTVAVSWSIIHPNNIQSVNSQIFKVY